MPSRLRLACLVLALVPVAVHAAACDGGDSNDTGEATIADGGPSRLPEAAVGPSDGESPATTMRLAHMASDLGPVDFCYRGAKASSFEGPVLGGGLGAAKPNDGGALDGGAADGSSGDGGAGAASIAYRTVSRYLNLETSGPLTLALVEPGATSCATPLFTADVTLDPGKLATVALVGRSQFDGGTGGLALVAFIDDRTTSPSKARVRMIHAALGTTTRDVPSSALAARAVGAQTVTVAERVEPKKASSASASVPVDSLGYATIVPVPSPAQLAVGAAADTAAEAGIDSWVSDPGALDLRGASLHTGFILTGADAVKPFEVLWCTDTSTSGEQTTCELIR